MEQLDPIKMEIEACRSRLVATRRDLHAHPETAFEEIRTARIVAQHLHALGLEVQTGVAGTGVVGPLRASIVEASVKTLAIRADMDALPIHELNDVDYRSQFTNKMHACGHDGHTGYCSHGR